jgi:sugar lactone lactonase YvrE
MPEAPEQLVASQNEVGETPMWIPEEKALYWIDSEGPRVYRWDQSGERRTYDPGFPITALLRRAAGGWVAAAKDGLYTWNHDTGESRFLCNPMEGQPDLRFNDAIIDRQGRLLAGTMNQRDLEAPDGALYRIDPDGSSQELDTGLAVANGIGLSPDGETVYVTDMFHGRILAYDYDTKAGKVDNRRIFATVPGDQGLPDGLIVDAEGFVWSAHWAGWRVTRYTPGGEIERQISLPTANVTCMAFGGEDLNELFITTAWFMLSEEDRNAQPMAGDLFRIVTDVKGLVEPAFAG